jgi:hypothetical protein
MMAETFPETLLPAGQSVPNTDDNRSDNELFCTGVKLDLLHEGKIMG